MRTRAALLLVAMTLSVAGCPKDNGEPGGEDKPLTAIEALQALDETSMEAQASVLTSGTIELATSFTIGGAVEQAADELRGFIASQLPCAELTLVKNKLSVEYGAKPGNCTFRGQTYSGTHEVTVSHNEAGDVEVDHAWTELQNQRLSVTGTAHVTWSLANKSRRVEYALTWRRLVDGRTGTGTGDVTQTALDGSVLDGIRVDGDRSWEGQRGRWDLAVNEIELRWADPVPQAGSYVLATPSSKVLTMTFSRVDEDTIEVSVTGGRDPLTFNVSKLGAITESK